MDGKTNYYTVEGTSVRELALRLGQSRSLKGRSPSDARDCLGYSLSFQTSPPEDEVVFARLSQNTITLPAQMVPVQMPHQISARWQTISSVAKTRMGTASSRQSRPRK